MLQDIQLRDLQTSVAALSIHGAQKPSIQIGSVSVFTRFLEEHLGYELVPDLKAKGIRSFAGIDIIENDALPRNAIAFLQGNTIENMMFLTDEEDT